MLSLKEKLVIIREDDISYFTDVEKLKTIYGPLIEREIPINFSVIPKVSSNIPLEKDNIYRVKEGLEQEPFIPPEYRGQCGFYEVGENKALVRFLKSLKNTDILQHGYTHGKIGGEKEFMINDEKKLTYMIENGKKIIERDFGKEPDFFVPPWDSISKIGLSLVSKQYSGISLFKLGITNSPPIMLPSIMVMKIRNKNYCRNQKFLAMEHFGCILSRFNQTNSIAQKIQVFLEKKDVFVLVNHHWEYFFDWADLNDEFYNTWIQIVNNLADRNDIKIVTFSEIYNEL